MTTITIEVTQRTLDAVRHFTEQQGMSVEGYLISVMHAHAKAAKNPLHTRVLHLVAQGWTDADIATEVGMNQTSTSIARVRRAYHVPANRRYRRAGN